MAKNPPDRRPILALEKIAAHALCVAPIPKPLRAKIVWHPLFDQSTQDRLHFLLGIWRHVANANSKAVPPQMTNPQLVLVRLHPEDGDLREGKRRDLARIDALDRDRLPGDALPVLEPSIAKLLDFYIEPPAQALQGLGSGKVGFLDLKVIVLSAARGGVKRNLLHGKIFGPLLYGSANAWQRRSQVRMRNAQHVQYPASDPRYLQAQ